VGAASPKAMGDARPSTYFIRFKRSRVYKPVGGMETTYVSMTDQTDRPTDPDRPPPTEYLSVRVTDAHTNWDKIKNVILDYEWYISYAEHGTSGTNPHFHVLLPGFGQRCSDKIRKRLKTAGYTGNRELSVKLNQNGLSSGIQYCSKEGPPFEIGGNSADVHRWIAAAPKWESNGRNIGAYLEKPERKKVKNPDHFYQITYQNIEKVTLRYRKENGIQSTELEDTLAAMHKDGWRVCLQMIKQGIPIPYYDQFTAACKGKSIFTSNRFAMMRRPVDYQAM